MSYTIKNMIDTDKVYDFLDGAFASAVQSLKDSNSLQYPNMNYHVFRNQADFDGTIDIPMYAEDDEAQKINYGLFRFIGGQVEPVEQLDIYGMRFSFEFLAFEEYRDDFNLILSTFSHSIQGQLFTLQYDDGSNITILVETNEFPIMSETIDANGANKFMTSNVIDILFYANAVHADQTLVLLNGDRLAFTEVQFTRTQVEPVVDLAKTFEIKMLPSKSSFSININGYYKTDNAEQAIFDWLLDETKLAEPIRFFYSDGIKVKTGAYLINESKFIVPDGAVISYALSLVPYKGVIQTHYGLLVTNSPGTGEYVVGDEIVLFNDDNFSQWQIQAFTTNQTILNYINSLDYTNENLEFEMPACDLKITAIKN
jgi:hypothetical protein